jgi:hypothetical protein
MGMTVINLPDNAIQRLRAQHECLYTLSAGLDEEALRLRPAPEKWSILENIAHLAAYQQVERILTETDPAFSPYVGDHDPYFLEARESPLRDLLADLSADRQYIYERVSALSPGQLSRRGVHARYGARSLTLWTEFFLLHEAHHCYTIWKISADSPWA